MAALDPALDTKVEDLPPGICYITTAAIFQVPEPSQSQSTPSPPKLLVVRRAADEKAFPNYWEMPGGKVDAGETLREGLVREVFEETGLTVTSVTAKLSEKRWENPRLGRKWAQFAFMVTVRQPAEVRLDPVEHQDWRWCGEAEVKALNRLENQTVFMGEAFRVEKERIAGESV